MFTNIFKKQPKRPDVVPIQLTDEQIADMRRFDQEEWPTPPTAIGKDRIAYFVEKDTVTPCVVKSIKRDDKNTTYKVLYNVDSVRGMKGGELFLTKQDAARNSIKTYWQDIQRLYKGLEAAGSMNRYVVDYTLERVAANKRAIAFLESQLAPAIPEGEAPNPEGD